MLAPKSIPSTPINFPCSFAIRRPILTIAFYEPHEHLPGLLPKLAPNGQAKIEPRCAELLEQLVDW